MHELRGTALVVPLERFQDLEQGPGFWEAVVSGADQVDLGGVDFFVPWLAVGVVFGSEALLDGYSLRERLPIGRIAVGGCMAGMVRAGRRGTWAREEALRASD